MEGAPFGGMFGLGPGLFNETHILVFNYISSLKLE